MQIVLHVPEMLLWHLKLTMPFAPSKSTVLLQPFNSPQITVPAESRHDNCISISYGAQCKLLTLVMAMLWGWSLGSTCSTPAQIMHIKWLWGLASMNPWMRSWSWKALGTSHFLCQEHPLMTRRASFRTRKGLLQCPWHLSIWFSCFTKYTQICMVVHQDLHFMSSYDSGGRVLYRVPGCICCWYITQCGMPSHNSLYLQQS